MDRSISRFEAELRIPLKPVLVALAGLGAMLLLLSDTLPGSPDELPALLLAAVFFSSAIVAWVLDDLGPTVGRWFTVVAIVAVTFLGPIWSGTTESLVFIVVPVVLAVALVGIRAGFFTAVGETVLLFGLIRLISVPIGLPHLAILVSLWAAFVLIWAVLRSMYERGLWIEDYFGRAQLFLQEARQRKVELEQMAESLAHANRQLALATERAAMLRRVAEEAQRAKTAFVANVSHEFRTPLNMIIGLVELIVDSPELYAVTLSPRMREDLEVVRRNCEHLASMVNDVLDLTRAEAGRLTLHRERVDLKEIVDHAVSVVRPLLEKKQLSLAVEMPSALPRVYCDRARIRQVILNLVSNAARYTEAGEIAVQVARQDQHVVVSVTDTGPGISAEDAERIFEPFSQGTQQLWRDKGGSGLGLSISRQFVRLHGGRMWLESRLGVGTTFFFTLPVSPPIEHSTRPGHQVRADWMWRERSFKAARLSCANELTKPRLVVYDETGGLRSELVDYSDEVEFVETRDSARVSDVVRQCPADAVIINTARPADLLSLAEQASQQAANTPVMICSVPRIGQRASDAGALGQLVKPVSRRDLERAIAAIGKPVRRVLVVDDDPDVVSLFTRMLHICDGALDITSAPSGQQALDCLRTGDFDLMLLDIVLPDISGWQVLEAMHHDEGVEAVPTFLVSAQDPVDEPPVSRFLFATIDDGLTVSRLLYCSLEMASLLLRPETELGPTPG